MPAGLRCQKTTTVNWKPPNALQIMWKIDLMGLSKTVHELLDLMVTSTSCETQTQKLSYFPPVELKTLEPSEDLYP